MLETLNVPVVKGEYRAWKEIQETICAIRLPAELARESIMSRMMLTPKVVIAAMIWLSVREDMKRPMAMYTQPIRKNASMEA